MASSGRFFLKGFVMEDPVIKFTVGNNETYHFWGTYMSVTGLFRQPPSLVAGRYRDHIG